MKSHKNKWIYLDSIEEVEKNRIRFASDELEQKSKQFTHIIIGKTWECGTNTKAIKDAIEIDAIKKNKEHILILTDDIVYLLNDEGKTIERIN